MAPVTIPCPCGPPCTYSTPAMEAESALTVLAMHERQRHNAQAYPQHNTQSKKPEKFPRPSIGLDETDEKWQDFTTAWDQYKDEYSLSGQAISRQLYACCSTELATSLSRVTGGKHFTLDEAELLGHMKKLSVQYQNPAVHTQEFLATTQQPDEGVRHYFSRLKGLSTHCNFATTCTCGETPSYADSIIRFKLIAGLVDEEIKEDILSADDKTLEDTVKTIETKESGKRARSHLGNSTSHTLNQVGTPTNKFKPCSHCGKTNHSSTPAVRERSCPAYSKKCGKCDRIGHFQSQCRSGKPRPNSGRASEVTGEVVDQSMEANSVSIGMMAGVLQVMSSVTREVRKASQIKVPHLLYEQLRWVQRLPPSHPTLTVEATVSVQGYNQNGFKPPAATKRRSADLITLPDTGCQACCLGPSQLHSLGLSESDLLTPALNLKAANATGINVLGAVFLYISGRGKEGKTWGTHQLCYVAEGLDQLLLSREACQTLGVIGTDFPTIGSHQKTPQTSINEIVPSQPPTQMGGEELPECKPKPDGTCDCPRRQPPPPPPDCPTGQSTEQLKQFILKYYAASTFNKCTRQPLPMMQGAPLSIFTDPKTRPVAAHSPIPIPLHWADQVKADLDRDVALGIIEPVPLNTEVTWCARMIIVPKHDGKPRRTVDFKCLNDASARQTHHTKSPFMLASEVPANTKKSVLDVWNAYHSVPVRKSDQDKLTFITPWGRFRYKVAPQGYLASGDGYTHRDYLISGDVSNKVTLVDDTLVWDESVEQNFQSVCRLLVMYGKAGLIMNGEKFQFGKDVVDFAGMEVTNSGVRPARKFLQAILEFPAPSNISEVRSFFGMVNQVNYAFSMSDTMEPFRHLLRPDTPFLWSPILQDRFEKAKDMIVKEVTKGVQHFEVGRPTCLATDWSKLGLGFFLLQKWCACKSLHPRCCTDGWKLVLAGGRFTSPAESRYSPVEGECLAIADALHRAKHFVLGCPDLIVATDHKPLVGLFNDRNLADIQNPRLLSITEKTRWFRFTVIHVPGRRHCGPDYMSRQGGSMEQSTKEARVSCILGIATSSRSTPSTNFTHLNKALVMSVAAALSHHEGLKAVTFERVKLATEKDQEMLCLRDAIANTDPASKLPDDLSEYNRYRDRLTVLDGVNMYGCRAIIPAALRHEVLQGLHAAHQCVGGMLERAKQTVFWPGIYLALEEVRSKCVECNTKAPSQSALPPLPLASPEYPFHMIVADYCTIKAKTWLVVADRFTGWVSVFYFPREALAKELVAILREMFCTFGVAENLSTDDGSQFRSAEMETFLQRWGVTPRLSSSYNPHSNLRAESAVKSAKRLLMSSTKSDGSPDWDKVVRALLQHRNTPIQGLNLSPAQLLFGRPIRDFLPVKPGQFCPSDVWVDCRERRELALRHKLSLGGERWSAHTKSLPPLSPGQHVFIQNQRAAGNLAKRWDKTGTVIECKGYDKYAIKVDGSGRLTDRNRRYLRSFKPATNTPLLPGPRPDQLISPPAMHDGHGVMELPPTRSVVPIPDLTGADELPLNQPAPMLYDQDVCSPVRDNQSTSTQPITPPSPPRPTPQTLPMSPPARRSPSPQTSPSPRPPSPPQPPIRQSTRVRKQNSKYSPNDYELNMMTINLMSKQAQYDDHEGGRAQHDVRAGGRRMGAPGRR